ncbi:PQQ-dependent sugar dehydrogenase [Photobacterium sagamiensis]|uniref:PQQ-dependent sugar dehydrogenase n=1 Tax=Photobacterium sagamiensis TaxID=2910241 RepID=UPI003D122BA4
MNYRVELLASGLGVPWGMVFVDSDHLLITQRHGAAVIVNPSTAVVTSVTGTPTVHAEGQGGLLDVAIPYRYRRGGWIYFTYSKNLKGQGVTVLARAKLNKAVLVDWQDLLLTRSASSTSRHYGSRIAFDNTGHLFATIGDRGERPNGQDLTTHAGSILRLKLDGSAPADNPFSADSGILPEIWSYGHRNPQGIAYDRETNRLWVIEHGPRGGDEINLIIQGKNYGWPITSHGKEYWGPVAVGEAREKPGIQSPVKVYIPSIAPGSLILYNGKAFPRWRGNLLAGALKLRHINRVILDKGGKAVGEERLLTELDQRIRALVQSPQGEIYFTTDSGNLYRIVPESR